MCEFFKGLQKPSGFLFVTYCKWKKQEVLFIKTINLGLSVVLFCGVLFFLSANEKKKQKTKNHEAFAIFTWITSGKTGERYRIKARSVGRALFFLMIPSSPRRSELVIETHKAKLHTNYGGFSFARRKYFSLSWASLIWPLVKAKIKEQKLKSDNP